jgi:hypothetical protein
LFFVTTVCRHFLSLSKPGRTIILVRIIKKELNIEEKDKKRRKTIMYSGRIRQ